MPLPLVPTGHATHAPFSILPLLLLLLLLLRTLVGSVHFVPSGHSSQLSSLEEGEKSNFIVSFVIYKKKKSSRKVNPHKNKVKRRTRVFDEALDMLAWT
jgi:hypothetical protein